SLPRGSARKRPPMRGKYGRNAHRTRCDGAQNTGLRRMDVKNIRAFLPDPVLDAAARPSIPTPVHEIRKRSDTSNQSVTRSRPLHPPPFITGGKHNAMFFAYRLDQTKNMRLRATHTRLRNQITAFHFVAASLAIVPDMTPGSVA